jgi:hypothetical protein
MIQMPQLAVMGLVFTNPPVRSMQRFHQPEPEILGFFRFSFISIGRKDQ